MVVMVLTWTWNLKVFFLGSDDRRLHPNDSWSSCPAKKLPNCMKPKVQSALFVLWSWKMVRTLRNCRVVTCSIRDVSCRGWKRPILAHFADTNCLQTIQTTRSTRNRRFEQSNVSLSWKHCTILCLDKCCPSDLNQKLYDSIYPDSGITVKNI